MGFNSNGDFIVGNTTLDSLITVTVDDYVADLPEVHSSGPIITPMSIEVRTIINWIERGLHVQFTNNKDAEKLLFFVMEYNKYAEQANAANKSDIEIKPLKLASNAQSYLIKKLHWQETKVQSEDESYNSDNNPFQKRTHSIKMQLAQDAPYTNASVQNKFKKKTESTVQLSRSPDEVRMYDIFSQTAQPDQPLTGFDSWMNGLSLNSD